MRRLAALLLAAAPLASCASVPQSGAALTTAEQQALAAAVAAPTRTPANVQRDRFRSPAGTLAFFGVRPNHHVVEVFPGGGWYTEVLAPYVVNGGGALWAAMPTGRGMERFRTFAATRPDLYGRIQVAAFPHRGEGAQVPNGSADVVLTFRNVHNWMMGDQPYAELAFRQMYDMLKPGGILGIEEHRLPESADSAREKTSGYVKVSTVRRLAEQAGFRFVGSSEVNANPRDTVDHPEGVWTLPPTLRLGDKDREKYLAIGESDRMTLKFVKPAR